MHGRLWLIFFCAKPGIDDRDAAADSFAGDEIAFAAEEEDGFCAGRLKMGDVRAVEVDDEVRVFCFDYRALHPVLVRLEAKLIADSIARLKFAHRDFRHGWQCYTTIPCNAHASRFSIRSSRAELWRLCGLPRL